MLPTIHRIVTPESHTNIDYTFGTPYTSCGCDNTKVRCLLCRLVFCCAACRRGHEAKVHGLLFDCPLCRHNLYTLGEDPAEDLLEHISASHLPLRCVKCEKVYEKMDSLTVDACPSGEAEAKAEMPKVAELKKQYEKHDVAAVMTSTPTHPSMPHWGEFQKSFTSTISGIHSPDSDGPLNEDKVVSNQISSIHVDSTSATPALPKSDAAGPSQQTTPAGEQSDVRRKRVTFAVELEKKAVAPIKPHVFLKPRRNPTPAKLKKRARTPRFQALLNNFTTTPKNVRVPQSGDDTPPSTEPNGNAITARTIDFKQESPTTSEGNSPKIDVNSPDTEMMSPQGSEVSTPDQYKSCIEDSPLSTEIVDSRKLDCVENLPKQIAGSVEDTLAKALSSEDFSTEIQFKIVITKKVVSLKETTKSINNRYSRRNDDPVNKKESTTIWSRLIDGVKWVLWGKKDDSDAALDVENAVPEHLASAKRKRYYSDLSESPIRNKRYRYSGRISGRRPLDRVLRRTILERSNSFGPELKDSEDNSSSLNRSF